MKNLKDVFVWDVDETLGSFGTLDYLVQMLEHKFKRTFTKEELYLLLDLFPEILRPNIVKYLKQLRFRMNKRKQKMIIYTNNVGPNSWVDMIKGYLEFKAKRQLFDKIIRAYKIDDIQVEQNRTDYSKNIDDLKRCLNVNNIKNVCFIDDQHHDLFNSENVDGLHIPPYFIQYDPYVIITRILNSPFKTYVDNVDEFYDFINIHGQPRKYLNPHEIMYSRIDDSILLNHLSKYFKKRLCRTVKIH